MWLFEELFTRIVYCFVKQIGCSLPVNILYHANRLNQLSVAVLKNICEYFDKNKEQVMLRRKAPYITCTLIGKLVQSCSCHEQQYHVFKAAG